MPRCAAPLLRRPPELQRLHSSVGRGAKQGFRRAQPLLVRHYGFLRQVRPCGVASTKGVTAPNRTAGNRTAPLWGSWRCGTPIARGDHAVAPKPLSRPANRPPCPTTCDATCHLRNRATVRMEHGSLSPCTPPDLCCDRGAVRCGAVRTCGSLRRVLNWSGLAAAKNGRGRRIFGNWNRVHHPSMAKEARWRWHALAAVPGTVTGAEQRASLALQVAVPGANGYRVWAPLCAPSNNSAALAALISRVACQQVRPLGRAAARAGGREACGNALDR